MKRSRKLKILVMMFSLCSMLLVNMPATELQAQAEPVYTVEFRGGSHGTYQGQTKTTLTSAYKGIISAIPEPDQIDAGFWFTGYEPQVETTVTESTVYVAQYARLIDAVEYRVNYVDTTGVSLATQKISYANAGETIHAYAPAIGGYTVDEAEKTAVAQQDGTEITFVYTLQNSSAGNTTGGNTAGGNTSGGNTSGGNTTNSNAAGGNTANGTVAGTADGTSASVAADSAMLNRTGAAAAAADGVTGLTTMAEAAGTSNTEGDIQADTDVVLNDSLANTSSNLSAAENAVNGQDTEEDQTSAQSFFSSIPAWACVLAFLVLLAIIIMTIFIITYTKRHGKEDTVQK